MRRFHALVVCLLGLVVACSGAPSAPADADVADTGAVPDLGAPADVLRLDVPEPGDGGPAVDSGSPGDRGPAEEMRPACVDLDGDGYPATECGGMAPDCDDGNNRVNPGRSEVCDARGADEDCNPCTVAGTADGDGDGDTFLGVGCFNRYAGVAPACDPLRVRIDGAMLRVAGRDCDDTDGNVRPDQTESCNGRDDNCNGDVDDGVTETRWYLDADRDGHGDQRATAMTTCMNPSTTTSVFVANNNDCDDADPARHVGARETCDRVDNDCDGQTDEEGALTVYPDADGDGFGNAALPMMLTVCTAPVGTVTRPGDCNDRAATTFLGAPELCDGVDNDCSLPGSAAGGSDPAEDRDGDRHAGTAAACAGGTFPRDDCDDTAAGIYPGATERCDGRDDNCDRVIDEAPRCPRSCASRTELGCGMTEVSGGTYQMGERVGTGLPLTDQPYGTDGVVTSVTVATFAMDNYEVTVARFRRFWDAGHPLAMAPVAYPGGRMVTWGETAVVAPDTARYCSWQATAGADENLPINCVDYWTAMSFCVWDGGRLPTEGEWEYAARGRAVDGLPVPRRYPWGSAVPARLVCDLAATSTCTPNQLRRVGSFAATGAFFDLAGNVTEWAADRHGSYGEDECWYGIPRTNPLCATQQGYGRTNRPTRGDSVFPPATNPYARYWSASRWRFDRLARDPAVGFRCARSR